MRYWAVTKAKNEELRTNVDGKEIRLNNTESLLKDLGNGLVDRHVFKNRCNYVVDDVEAIVNKASIIRNQKRNSRNYVTVKRNFKS